MRRAQPWVTNRTRTLRANQTSAERRLWSALRDRRLDGFKFTRQFSIGPYFADFVCRELRLIVEVDGATHGEAHEIAHDQRRDLFLKNEGYRVLRVRNDDVRQNLDGGVTTILMLLKNRDDVGIK